MLDSINPEIWALLGVSRESLTRLEVLVALLQQWQRRINLIAPSTLAEIWSRHILDSAQLLPLIPPGVRTIADLGSGAGFPALVLAAIQPAEVHLYESNGKKAAFLREGLRQMKVEGVVHAERLELRKAPALMPQAQLVTARAFAPLPELLAYCEPFFSQGATGLFHKGQDVDAELTQAAKFWRITARKHFSLTDSKAVILDVKEITRVNRNQGR